MSAFKHQTDDGVQSVLGVPAVGVPGVDRGDHGGLVGLVYPD
jgi:hypothetical protein